MSTERNFSVMPVQVEGEPKAIERAVRSSGSNFQVGCICTIEFGATWATIGDRQQRIDGQWFRCQILRHEGAIVHVRIMPDVRLSSSVHSDQRGALCVCGEGWIRESTVGTVIIGHSRSNNARTDVEMPCNCVHKPDSTHPRNDLRWFSRWGSTREGHPGPRIQA